jgi:hypothetical protein
VKRVSPVTASWPTVPSISPRVIGSSAEASVPPDMRDITINPPAVSAKNSAGPNRIATFESSDENSMTPITASVPPTKEPTATMVSVAPARPFLAS